MIGYQAPQETRAVAPTGPHAAGKTVTLTLLPGDGYAVTEPAGATVVLKADDGK